MRDEEVKVSKIIMRKTHIRWCMQQPRIPGAIDPLEEEERMPRLAQPQRSHQHLPARHPRRIAEHFSDPTELEKHKMLKETQVFSPLLIIGCD